MVTKFAGVNTSPPHWEKTTLLLPPPPSPKRLNGGHFVGKNDKALDKEQSGFGVQTPGFRPRLFGVGGAAHKKPPVATGGLRVAADLACHARVR